MPINRQQARRYLKQFEFKPLFVQELGWDYYTGQNLPISIEGQIYNLTPLVEKRGVIVYCCNPDEHGRIPEYATRRQIERQVAKYVHEHLIIYIDAAHSEQVWLWVRREVGKPAACREHRFDPNQSGAALLQKLEAIAFSLEEEESLTLVEVTGRTRRAFDVDRVTKKFYERFKKEHAAFLQLIQGINIPSDLEWYASLMLNRLMFIYFIQKQGFLDGDRDYLRCRLRMCQQQNGRDAFHSFYRYFLLRLCHEGLGKQERTFELEQLLGKVPYLNGGLFEVHSLEIAHPDIQIPDSAFEKIFSFFEEYQWHLDERPLRNDQEINPDVLGYIFEKYTNQKQMGAYYTKEDITEYISKNCIIPFIIESVDKQVGNSLFKPNGLAWKLLREDPDRYIYKAVRQGVDTPLPNAIAAGIDDVSRRDGWNRPANPELALPTETWREHIARRNRCLELRQKLASGEIQSINDLITYNLDIRQLAQDVTENCFDPELLSVMYQAISQITVLDPTCGSGAFLFAALNILEALYDACLERMQTFLNEDYRFSDDTCVQRLQQFRQILQPINQHLNRRYFILKSIVINNLYGVDIMQEATEICKLRLFLKLMAQVEPDASQNNYGVEPLPDIDFNIRAGNTLVGFTSYDEVKKAVEGEEQKKLDLFDNMARIDEKAKAVDQSFQNFRKLQTERVDGRLTTQKKAELRSKLQELRDELDRYLADEYETGQSKKPVGFKKWKNRHQPFHWFVEFYGILSSGGFNVIIGNPPYVEYSKIRRNYTVQTYYTERCGNLYAFVIERSINLLNKNAFFSLIVPHSLAATYRSNPIQELLVSRTRGIYSYYTRRPGKLFEGADQCLCIFIASLKPSTTNVCNLNNLSTTYQRWYTEERTNLFSTLDYCSIHLPQYWQQFHVYPKIGQKIEHRILEKISKQKPLSNSIKTSGTEFYCHRISRYFIKATDFVPYFRSERDGVKRSDDFKLYYAPNEKEAVLIVAVLNSSLFYWFWRVMFDGYHCGKENISAFPFEPKKVFLKRASQLQSLVKRLMNSYLLNSERKYVSYKGSGNVEYDQFSVKKSKSLIDEIDRILAEYYGFTSEELDFIINYDIKYRMGRESEDED